MNNDGHCLLDISPEGMLVHMTLTPATAGGHQLTMEDLEYEFRAAGVIDGVNWVEVRRALEECVGETRVIRDLIVARGTHPRPAMPEVLVFPPRIQSLDPVFLPPERQEQNASFSAFFTHGAALPNPAEDHKAGAMDEHGNIDFRETHGVFVIQEGQVLAVLRHAVEGMPGRTVRGEYVPFQTLKVTHLAPGPNTELIDGRIRATRNGRLVWNSGNFGVDENLELTTDVGYKTGNIRFPGNLILKAGIKDRFKVWVGGNLEATGVVDAYEVFCGKDLLAKAGIIGRGKGLVRAKGAVDTRFVENCLVESLGPIRVETSSFHANLYTSDTVSTSDKGRVVGGEIHAYKGMTVNNLGNPAGSRTVVYLGRDYVVQRKMDFVKDKQQEITIALHKLEDRIASLRAAGHEVGEAMVSQRTRLEEDARHYQEQLGEILDGASELPDAVLTVHGSVYPGVVVDICGVDLEIRKEQKAVQFCLEKDKIVAKALNKDKPA